MDLTFCKLKKAQKTWIWLGAVASIAFGCVTPIVDGNVIRVLSRLRAVKQYPKAGKFVWSQARSLVKDCRDIKSFNQGLMELGKIINVFKWLHDQNNFLQIPSKNLDIFNEAGLYNYDHLARLFLDPINSCVNFRFFKINSYFFQIN